MEVEVVVVVLSWLEMEMEVEVEVEVDFESAESSTPCRAQTTLGSFRAHTGRAPSRKYIRNQTAR